MLRVVLDTNILVSAVILPDTTPAAVLSSWQSGKFTLVTCQAALNELDEVLQRPHIATKYHVSQDKRQTLLSVIQEHVILVPGDTIIGAVVADPKDDKFIACAAEGEAKYIVSGDKHLLNLRRYRAIRIMTAAYFLAVLARCERRFLS